MCGKLPRLGHRQLLAVEDRQIVEHQLPGAAGQNLRRHRQPFLARRDRPTASHPAHPHPATHASARNMPRLTLQRSHGRPPARTEVALEAQRAVFPHRRHRLAGVTPPLHVHLVCDPRLQSQIEDDAPRALRVVGELPLLAYAHSDPAAEAQLERRFGDVPLGQIALFGGVGDAIGAVPLVGGDQAGEGAFERPALDRQLPAAEEARVEGEEPEALPLRHFAAVVDGEAGPARRDGDPAGEQACAAQERVRARVILTLGPVLGRSRRHLRETCKLETFAERSCSSPARRAAWAGSRRCGSAKRGRGFV
jgi:hypothetical protein